jgi:BON domain
MTMLLTAGAWYTPEARIPAIRADTTRPLRRRAKVAVSEGVVTLAGYVEKKSMIRLAVGMSRAVDGVVDVIDHLGYTDDDTHATQAPEPLARWLSIDLEDRLGGGDRS